MAWTDFVIEKKSWEHEKKRAAYFGKPQYQQNCQAAIDNLELFYPELIGVTCDCSECQSGIFTNGH